MPAMVYSAKSADAVSGTAGVFLLQTRIMESGVISGTIHRFSPVDSVPFCGLDQAVLRMDGWMDECGFLSGNGTLRAFQTGRTQKEAEPAAGSTACRGASGKGESFLIRVYHRQNTSWQGEVCWRDRRCYFRSVLELIALIRSGMGRDAAAENL